MNPTTMPTTPTAPTVDTIQLSWDDLITHLSPEIRERAAKSFKDWLARGDGVAVYEDQYLGGANYGHKKFVSFGSHEAQLEVDQSGLRGLPPQRLPDIGNTVNWRYVLIGFHR
jgi:hypothetical protein